MTARDWTKASAPAGTPRRGPGAPRVNRKAIRDACTDPELEAYGRALIKKRQRRSKNP